MMNRYLRTSLFFFLLAIVPAYSLFAERRVINYPGSAFSTIDAYQYASVYVGSGGGEISNYYNQFDPRWVTLNARAHLALPAGSRITGLKVWAVDLHANHVISFAIVSNSFDGRQQHYCLGDTTYTSGDDWEPDEYTTLKPCSVVMDEEHSYSIILVIPPGGSALFASGVQIEYETAPAAPAPSFATFADVPVGHPLHKFVEALYKAGLTGGCGNGNFCPDSPLTRGQIAVFLSQALGLGY